MVQSLSVPTLALKAIPLQQPTTSPTDSRSRSVETEESTAAASNLLLRPGERSGLLLRLENKTLEPLQLTISLSGHIPDAWCLTPLGPYELSPHTRQEIELQFQAPADFFETLTELAPGERRPLNYSGRVDVYGYTPTGTLKEIASALVTFLVRPHSPYTPLLPQVFQEIDFVQRFLAIVERTFSPVVETWNGFDAYLNPLLSSEAMLPFLAHWVGWQHLPELTSAQQRRLIHRAIELYSWRGTTYGLTLYLHLVTGLPIDPDDTPAAERSISIVEPSQEGAVFGESSFQETTAFGGGRGLHFSVVLRPPEELVIDETLVQKIIDQERPAFCTYDLTIRPQNLS